MQRRRRRNLREKNRARTVMGDSGRNTSGNENTTEFEDLAYIDTLPEVSREVKNSQCVGLGLHINRAPKHPTLDCLVLSVFFFS